MTHNSTLKKKIILLGMFAFTVFTFAACTKAKDGAPGAQGPQGVQGNANVQSYTFSNQTFTYVAADSASEMNLRVLGITKAIIDAGAVSVSIQPTTDAGTWLELPTTLNGGTFNVGYSLDTVGIIVSNHSVSGIWNVKVVVM